MSTQDIIYLIIAGCAGGFVNGLAGTGTALFALGFLLHVLDPLRAVATIALLAILSGVQGIWEVRSAVVEHKARLFRFLIPGLIGVPIGVALLTAIDPRALRLLVAGILIFYGGYFGFRSALPKFDQRTPKTDVAVGLIGGVMGGAASLSGALPAIWCTMRPWPKQQTRAILQPFNVAILGTTVTMLALKGAYDRTTISALMIVLPAGLVAIQVGLMVFRRLSDNAFRRLLILLCLILGTGILLRELI